MIKRQLYWLGVVLAAFVAITASGQAQHDDHGNHGYRDDHGNHDDHGDHDDRGGARDRDHAGAAVFLGDRHVDGRADRDNIEIKPQEGWFRAIQFRVDGGLVKFSKVIIHFRNGDHQELAVRADIPSGGRTRWIDLPGRRRAIQSVEMWYGKANWRTRPTINLYGMK